MYRYRTSLSTYHRRKRMPEGKNNNFSPHVWILVSVFVFLLAASGPAGIDWNEGTDFPLKLGGSGQVTGPIASVNDNPDKDNVERGLTIADDYANTLLFSGQESAYRALLIHGDSVQGPVIQLPAVSEPAMMCIYVSSPEINPNMNQAWFKVFEDDLDQCKNVKISGMKDGWGKVDVERQMGVAIFLNLKTGQLVSFNLDPKTSLQKVLKQWEASISYESKDDFQTFF